MEHAIGWIIWGILTFLAVSFLLGCRRYASSGERFQQATGIQTFLLWIVAVFFLFFSWNKIHILWIVPVLMLLAPIITQIPILSTVVLFVTKIFLSIVLVGIKIPNLQSGSNKNRE